MSKFLSGREREFKVGIVSYTENNTVLEVVGNSNFTGIVTASGGFNLGISSAGTSITSGPITNLNFIGAGNTFAVNGTTVDISIAGGGGGESYWSQTSAGINTLSNVGIGTTNPTSKLTVDGDAYFSGIVTAKRFQTYWPEGSVDYNFLAGYQSGELIDSGSDYNVLIGYQAGYDISNSDHNVALGYQSLYGGASNIFSFGNVAIGYQTLFSITTGDYNVAIGYDAADGLTSGYNNIAIGQYAIAGGTFIGSDNVAIGGRYAGYLLTTGFSNVLVGSYAGYQITTGDYNVCLGHRSGYNLDGNQSGNTLLGYQTGYGSDLGDYNVCVGYEAGYSQESDGSVFIGRASGYISGNAGYSVAIGYYAGYDLEGDYNVAIGPSAMQNHNGGGTYNIAIGHAAMFQDGTNSSFNIAIGYKALYGESTTTGSSNIGIGYQAGEEITTGIGNLLLGNYAGDSITSGSRNVVIVAGDGAPPAVDVPSGTSDGQLVIGYDLDAWIWGDSSYNVGLGSASPTAKLDVVGDVKVSGNISATSASFSGNVSIAGTLTYEDVTNIDSVGLITARSGIQVLSGGIDASGIVTASGGFNLGISSAGTTITSGPVTALNFIGAGNTFAVNGTTVDISIAGGGGGGASVSIGTEAPVSPSGGDLWYNNNLGRIFIYYDEVEVGVGSTAVWIDAAPFNPLEPASTPGKTTATFTATEGQTVFTTSFNVGYIDVFLNGIRLNSSEYAEGDGTKVTLIQAASAGDIIDVVQYTMGIGNTGATGPAGPLSGVSSITTDGTYYPLIVSGVGSVSPYVSINSDYLNFNPSSGTLTSNQLNIVGVSTFSSVVASQVNVSGVSTFSSVTASQVNVSGVSTFSSVTASQVNVSGVCTALDFNSTSDRGLKDNIQRIENPIEKVSQINGVSFTWKDTQQSSAGVIAQDVENVLPEIIRDNPTGYKSLNYNGLIGLLIESVKDQQEQINMLRKEIEDLKK